MGQILHNWRVLTATVFSVVLVIGAYVLARGVESPSVAQASTETALLQAIAAKDTDGDGLPDWEEALYGTSPNITDTNHLGMTDGEAVAKGLIVPKDIADIPAPAPASGTTGAVDYAASGLTPPTEGSLTDAFAKNFFALYATAKEANGGGELSSDQTSALADQAVSQLSQTFAPAADFKKASDIKVSGSGSDALRAFAVSAEQVLKKNANDATKSDLQYFQDAVVNGDTSALAHLASLADTYRNSATGIAVLPVPQELAANDLAVVNALMHLGQIYSDFARVNADPLTAMLALEQYRETELVAERAFADLFNTYLTAGILLKNGTPGASFVNIMANITASQRAGTTP